MRMLVAEAHDSETCDALSVACRERHAVDIVDQLTDPVSAVMPAKSRLHQIARHQRKRRGFAASSEPQCYCRGVHGRNSATTGVPEVRRKRRECFPGKKNPGR